MMQGVEALKIIARHQGDAVVITTETPFLMWDSISANQELHLPVINSMGKASSVGLGLALARPDLKVMVIDADGSLLMNLGSLVTIANRSPGNLLHFVYQNNVYGVSGGQPLPGIGRFSFAGLAKSAGYPNAFEFDQLEDFALKLPQLLEMVGPTLACLKVEDQWPTRPLPARHTTHAFHEVAEALARSNQD